MQETEGNAVEKWIIMVLRAAATLPFNLPIEPLNSSAQTQPERCYVECVFGPKQSAGEIKPGGRAGDNHNDAVLTITFKTVNRMADEANDIAAKINAAVKSPASIAYVNTHFFDLSWIDNQAQFGIQVTSNFRVFTFTIPLIVGTL
jgi:hypothetical protein